MGYYVRILESTARIPKENLDEAYRRMCELDVTHHHLKRGGSYDGSNGKTQSWFSWMPANYVE